MGQLNQFMTNHWELCLAFLVITLLIYINEWISLKKAPKSLSPQAVIEKINHEAATIIDLREQALFSAGHIINAIRATADDFALPRLLKYKNKPVILVCAKGVQSQSLATKLSVQGFEHAMILAGGLTAWQDAGLPLVKGNK